MASMVLLPRADSPVDSEDSDVSPGNDSSDDDSPGNDSSDDHLPDDDPPLAPNLDWLIRLLRDFLKVRQLTLNEIRSLKCEIEESYNESRKAKIGGAVSAVAGSALGIVGFGLAFVTFGASLSLMVVGGALGAAGGATIVGAEIGYLVVWKKRMKRVEEVCERDERQLQHVREALVQHFESPSEKQGVDSTGSFLLSGVAGLGQAAATAGDGARVGARIAARTIGQSLGLVGNVVGGIGVALDAIMIPVDLFVILKGSMDVSKYQGGRGESNSNAAAAVGKILKELQVKTDQIKDILFELENRGP